MSRDLKVLYIASKVFLMYLGGNRRWVPLSFKLVGSKFNRYRSLHRYRILVILTIPERLSTRKKPST